MNSGPVKDYVKELIADFKHKEALKILSQFVKGVDSTIEDDVMLFQATLNRNERNNKRGLLSNADYELAMSRIGFNIAETLKALPATGNSVNIPANSTSPPAAEPVSTGRPAGGSTASTQSGSDKKTILFMKANPQDTVPLNLDAELRKVKNALESSTLRDKFELITEEAVQIHTITKALMKHKPDIVHFSGHGEGDEGLAVEDAIGNVVMFPTAGLDRLFKMFKTSTQCVVLNACYASEQAKVISEHEIHVIGMNKAVLDTAAGNFSLGFYQSLFEGNDFEFAFNMAMVNISSHLNDAQTPEMWFNGKIILS